jgi:hypothetical protein
MLRAYGRSCSGSNPAAAHPPSSLKIEYQIERLEGRIPGAASFPLANSIFEKNSQNEVSPTQEFYGDAAGKSP